MRHVICFLTLALFSLCTPAFAQSDDFVPYVVCDSQAQMEQVLEYGKTMTIPEAVQESTKLRRAVLKVRRATFCLSDSKFWKNSAHARLAKTLFTGCKR